MIPLCGISNQSGECRFLGILLTEKDLLCKSQNFQVSYADFAKQPLLRALEVLLTLTAMPFSQPSNFGPTLKAFWHRIQLPSIIIFSAGQLPLPYFHSFRMPSDGNKSLRSVRNRNRAFLLHSHFPTDNRKIPSSSCP